MRSIPFWAMPPLHNTHTTGFVEENVYRLSIEKLIAMASNLEAIWFLDLKSTSHKTWLATKLHGFP